MVNSPIYIFLTHIWSTQELDLNFLLYVAGTLQYIRFLLASKAPYKSVMCFWGSRFKLHQVLYVEGQVTLGLIFVLGLWSSSYNYCAHCHALKQHSQQSGPPALPQHLIQSNRENRADFILAQTITLDVYPVWTQLQIIILLPCKEA
jgi:hypothetical protein